MRRGPRCERLDVEGVIVPGRRDAQDRLAAHLAQNLEGLVASGRRRRRAILRIERHEQQAVAAFLHQRLDPLLRRGLAVAHRPIDADALALASEARLQHFGLGAGDRLERPLVTFLVPDRGVVAALGAGPHRQDHEIEERPPKPARGLDHAPVGKELLEIAAHRPIIGRLRRAEVDEEHADPARPRGDVRRRLIAGIPGLRIGLHALALGCAEPD